MGDAPTGLRVLGRLRLSRSTDESTSIERQRETIQRWADAQGHRIVGWAEDVDVSGAVDPFDTPQLGPWLTPDRAAEWDTLAAWKLDRLGRNAIQLNRLFGWCNEHGKTLVSCSESIDLSSWAGRMLAGVIAGLAEGELEAIRERSRSSRAKLRESARWAGGKPPFGYRVVPREGGGWALEPDPVAVPLVRRIVDDVLNGKPLNRVATELNTEGYRTPRDYYVTVKAGAPSVQLEDREERTSRWQASTLRNLLQNPALRGHVHHKGQTVRDDEGVPLVLAEPLVDSEEWDALQAVLEGNRKAREHHKRPDAAPLAGVISCIWCGENLHHNQMTVKGNRYRYYRCPNHREHSDNGVSMVPAAEAETLLEELFLDEAGDLPVTERVWVPGDTRDQELREAVTALDELTRLVGTISSATARERLTGQINAVDRRILELESQPVQEAHWEYREIGGTYGEVWENSDTDERRDLLLRSGIVLRIGVQGRRGGHHGGVWKWELHVPEPITDALGR
ncbi:recombinase family protein [Rhodococcus pyridinivorans]|uniref:recombinase family protein n=1 Tax=Rhodococcus pyridinivorans TaxID=103816 RepID=UPI0020C754EE|nr:recombinase family protein [Rhodococcus pyridinivorans]